mgnify:CR=1 FL=1
MPVRISLMIDRRVIVYVQKSAEQDTPVSLTSGIQCRIVGTGNERCAADIRIVLDVIDLTLVYHVLGDKTFQVLHTLGGERVKFIQVDEQARRQLQQMVIVLGNNHAITIIILQFRREEMSDKGTLSFPCAPCNSINWWFARCRRWRTLPFPPASVGNCLRKKLGLPLVQFSSFVR